jgi:hypothetical protein
MREVGIMKLAPSVQRRILELTPALWLDSWCRSRPKFVIELLCHWISEKNPEIEERGLALRKSTALVSVAKKLSKISALSFLYLLQQDENLWKYYSPPAGFTPMRTLPYILLEIIYDLGGNEGRKKIIEVVQRSRQTLGGRKQGDILENFKVDIVLEIFESLPEFDVRMRLMFNEDETVAFWLNHWDQKMRNMNKAEPSLYWLGRLSGKRAYRIQALMRNLEFRRKYWPLESIYKSENEWKDVKGALKDK